MKRSRNFTLAASVLVFLFGCIAIPVGESEPFPEEVTKTIVAGKTSRKNVLTTLGAPLSTNANETLFLYSEQQLKYALIFCLPYGGCGGIPIGPTHNYIISFARNGTVANMKAVTKISNYCRRGGSCLVTVDDLDVWYAPAAIEASAKKFTPISDKCTIYLLRFSGLKIAIDRRKTIQFPIGGGRLFHRIVVPAGIHELSYPENEKQSVSFQCDAGDMVFFEPSLKYSYKPRVYIVTFEFTLMDPKKAKSKILRSRMLDPGK